MTKAVSSCYINFRKTNLMFNRTQFLKSQIDLWDYLTYLIPFPDGKNETIKSSLIFEVKKRQQTAT